MRMLADCRAPKGHYRLVKHTRPNGVKHREIVDDYKRKSVAMRWADTVAEEDGFFCVVVYDDQGRPVSGQIWSESVIERREHFIEMDDWLWRDDEGDK